MKNSKGKVKAYTPITPRALKCIAQEKRAMNTAIYISIIGNVLLFAAKYIVGIISHSIAIQADAWHTLSDILTSLIVIIGYRFAHKPADRQHPFGHGRYELVSTMLVGMFLIAVAGMFTYQGIGQILNRTKVVFGPLAIGVTVLSIIIKEGIAQYTFYIAKKINNPALRADSWHHRSDALSSVVVLAGVLVGKWFWWMDGVLAIGVSILIAWVAVKTFRSVSSAIVGEAPADSLKQDIADTINNTFPELNLQPHRFNWHNYIQHQEITLHIILPKEFTVGQAFEITTRLEDLIMQKFSIAATIRIEPIPSEKSGANSTPKE